MELVGKSGFYGYNKIAAFLETETLLAFAQFRHAVQCRSQQAILGLTGMITLTSIAVIGILVFLAETICFIT